MLLRLKPTPKQFQAHEILQDKTTEAFLFGGAAGGGKSWLICEWLLSHAIGFPNTRYFIGREELKRLRDSTYITFFKVCKFYGVTPEKEFTYNGADHYFKFFNGSRIDLLDLKYLPRDPLYERYGSTEYTSGAIEEGGEVVFAAFDTLKSRVGRCYNDKHDLFGKILITSNPKKNWLYSTFYKPSKTGALPGNYAFLQSLVGDNPHIEEQYIQKLHDIKDKTRKERLLYGNWEYEDDPATLIDYDSITDVFTNEHVDIDPEGDVTGKGFITCDVARFGADKSVIMRWNGWRMAELIVIEKSSMPELAEVLKDLCTKNAIPMSHTLVDEAGVGGGVVDILHCKGFVGGSKPVKVKYKEENFVNLRSQCYFRLADIVNKGGLYFPCNDEQVKEMVVEELEQVKQKDPDTDGKRGIIPKDKIKELLGRSPDFSDTISMRVWFDIAMIGRTLAMA